MKVSGRHVSVDAPFAEGEDNSLLDVMVNNDSPKADIELMRNHYKEKLNDHFLPLLIEKKMLLCYFWDWHATWSNIRRNWCKI